VRRNGFRAGLVVGLFALAGLSSSNAWAHGPTYGTLGLAYERSTTNFIDPPERRDQSAYHPCGGGTPGIFVSGGGWLEGNPTFNIGEAGFASLYPVDELGNARPDGIREVSDNTSHNNQIQLGESTVCGEVQDRTYVSHKEPSPGRERSSAKVGCPNGTHVLGGGGKSGGKFKSQRLVGSSPFDDDDANDDPDDGWRIAVDNMRRHARSITAYATCAPVSGVSYASSSAKVPDHTRAILKAFCPGGEYATGGGLSQTGPFGKVKLIESRFEELAAHDGWFGGIDNISNRKAPLKAFTICHA
jgi:hypothetical protein